jgi:hypothetical protein
MKPLNQIVEALVCRLDANLRETFEERAGIMQFEAGKPRELSEALALLDVIRSHPLAVCEVRALNIELDGQSLIVVTADQELANKHFADIGATPVALVDLAQAVRDFGIAAVLAHLG